MALLKREEWQGFVRDVDWSYRYVDDEAVYPEWMSGTGKVRTIGKPLWTGLIASFPNLSNTVQSVTSNDDGDVVVQADIEGTQQLAWGLITPAGRHYREPHLFVFHVGPDLLIDDITAYWNDAGISQQLGHNEVD